MVDYTEFDCMGYEEESKEDFERDPRRYIPPKPKTRVKFLSEWEGKGYQCVDCGTRLSVKYIFNEQHYCNLCILGVAYGKPCKAL